MNLKIMTASALFPIIAVSTAIASDFNGTWCRQQHKGMPDDIIWITPDSEVNSVRLTEGWNGKAYSQGVASVSGNTLFATLKGEQSGTTIHAVMTVSGNQLSYRSYKDNKTVHNWKGDYYRCKKQ